VFVSVASVLLAFFAACGSAGRFAFVPRRSARSVSGFVVVVFAPAPAARVFAAALAAGGLSCAVRPAAPSVSVALGSLALAVSVPVALPSPSALGRLVVVRRWVPLGPGGPSAPRRRLSFVCFVRPSFARPPFARPVPSWGWCRPASVLASWWPVLPFRRAVRAVRSARSARAALAAPSAPSAPRRPRGRVSRPFALGSPFWSFFAGRASVVAAPRRFRPPFFVRARVSRSRARALLRLCSSSGWSVPSWRSARVSRVRFARRFSPASPSF